MECFVSFLALIVLLTFVASLGSRSRSWCRQARRNFRRLADERDGVFACGGWFRRNCVRFRYRAAGVVLRAYSAGRVAHTRLEIDWPDARFRCEIAPVRYGPGTATWRGLRRINIGVERFDRDYAIFGDNPQDVRAFLSEGVQWQVDRLRRFPDAAGVRIRVDDGCLFVEKASRMQRYEELAKFTELALDLYDQAMLTRSFGIEFLDEDSAQLVGEAVCQVCGEDIGDDMVICPGCKTPHHRDCWQYNGGCSIYGCRETRFTTLARSRPDVRAAGRRKEN